MHWGRNAFLPQYQHRQIHVPVSNKYVNLGQALSHSVLRHNRILKGIYYTLRLESHSIAWQWKSYYSLWCKFTPMQHRVFLEKVWINFNFGPIEFRGNPPIYARMHFCRLLRVPNNQPPVSFLYQKTVRSKTHKKKQLYIMALNVGSNRSCTIVNPALVDCIWHYILAWNMLYFYQLYVSFIFRINIVSSLDNVFAVFHYGNYSSFKLRTPMHLVSFFFHWGHHIYKKQQCEIVKLSWFHFKD